MPDTGFEVRGVWVTPHAVKRMRQRLGLNRRALEREVERVLEHGIDGRETVGRLRSWVDYVMSKQEVKGTKVLLTTAGAFMVRGETVVTVLKLDGRLVRIVAAMMRKKGDRDGRC